MRLTRGRLGVDFSPTTVFDIMPTPDGGNRAFAVSRRVLYRIATDPQAGRRIATIGGSYCTAGLGGQAVLRRDRRL